MRIRLPSWLPLGLVSRSCQAFCTVAGAGESLAMFNQLAVTADRNSMKNFEKTRILFLTRLLGSSKIPGTDSKTRGL